MIILVNIKNMREKTGLTQRQLAEQLGVGRTAVAMWELGKSVPRSDKLPALARILDCTIDELFCGTRESEEMRDEQPIKPV